MRKKKTIFKLFLCEALTLSAAGGLLGVVSGIGTVQIISYILPALPTELAWSYVAAAFALSLFIGMVSGVMPALKAAHLEPLQALHSE